MKIFDHKSGEYLEIEGAKVYYEVAGNKNKPPLVVLHGGFGDIEDMNSVVSCFANDFCIIGIDSRGHGKSTLGDYNLSYKRLQHDVETILEHLKINKVSILGFSDGGIIGYRIAANKTIVVNNLVAIGASWSNKDIDEVENVFRGITAESVKEIFSENYKKYMLLNPEPDLDKLIPAITSMWLDRTEAGHPDETVKNISAETLLIRGDGDFLVSLESLSELKGKIKNAAFLNVPFAHHVVFQEQLLIVETALKQFFEIKNS